MIQIIWQVNLKGLTGLEERLKDLRPAWRLATVAFWQAEQKWFQTEGEGEWPPLAASTQRKKDAFGGGDQILVETDELEKSLTGPHTNNVVFMTENMLTIGTSDEKAWFHQYGTQNMPERQPIPTPLFGKEPAFEEIVNVVQAYISGSI